jgi:hypothetical protein
MDKTRWDFIPDTIADRGSDFDWEGKNYHIGPVETRTKLLDSFAGITSCGSFCIASGLLVWTSCRFSKLLDVKSTLHLSDAALAFMFDPLCIDTDALMEERVPDQPPVESAFRQLRWYGAGAIYPGRWYQNANAPRRDLFHFAYLLRYLLDKKSAKIFDTWIATLTSRLHKIAPKPELRTDELPDDPTIEQIREFVAPHWGLPVPHAALSKDVAPEEILPLSVLEANEIDWKSNPFVRHDPNTSSPYGRKAP